MDTTAYILYTGTFCFLLSVLASAIPKLKDSEYLFALPTLGSVLFGIAGLRHCLDSRVVHYLDLPLSSFFTFSFGMDALSGFFVVIISILACAVSVYSIGYVRDLSRKGLMVFLYNLFVLSLYAVVTAENILTFLISWETMSIVSYFLVTFDRDEKSVQAGLLYAMMTHLGTAFILAAFLLLSVFSGHMDFPSIRSSMSTLPEGAKSLIFLFVLIGFGTKAGIIPLHTWLPKAHPAAPSHISSLMSGVMIKTGIYGLIRICVDVMGGGPPWWGIAVIAVGAVSSVLGVLYALMEHDLKRLLAYHSVENIGIILLGLGAALSFGSYGLTTLSALALTAALYHTLNHALFKGLLFLSAGAVVHAAHTKNMEYLGGLIKTMPYTGFFFLIGSVSICALPPFNGFVSEWLTYQALLLGFASPSITSKIVSPLGGAALALTGALAAACFVKAFGISFLGLPRSSKASAAKEVSVSMIAGMAFLAVLCLAFGILPGWVIAMLSIPVSRLTGAEGVLVGNAYLFVGQTASGLSPLGILFTVIVMGVAAGVFAYMVGGRRKIVYGDSWDCGMPALTSRMQYTATAFTKPVRQIFKRIYLPRRDVKISYLVKPLFVKSMRYSGEIVPFFDKYIYEPLISFAHRCARRVMVLQSGSLHLYLGYILITLVVLLVFGT